MLKRILTARETILAAAILALLVLIAVRFPAFVAPSNLIAPPRLADAPVSFECRLHSAVMTGPKQMIAIGRVVAIHIQDRFLLNPERGYVDTPALDLLARMHGGGWYRHGGEMLHMERPTFTATED